MMLISLLTIKKPCSDKATYLTSCFRKCHTDAPINTAAQAVQLIFQLKKQDFIMSNGWHLYLLLIPLFFLLPLLLCADWKILSFISLLLPATGAGCRISARGTIQTEAFWNKGGDLTSAPRLAEQRDRVHRAGGEVDNCRRPSFEVPHRSGTWEGVWGGGSLCWLVGTEPDKEKPEPQPVWGVIPVADNKGSEKGLCVCVCVFCELVHTCLCVCAHCQPYTHTPLLPVTMDTKAQDLKLSPPAVDVHTSQAQISLLTHQEKGAFPLAVQWKFKWAGSRRFALRHADFFDIWQ